MNYSVWGTVISCEEREKQLAPSNVVSIAMVYDSIECQNKTYENYIYVCSVTYTFVSHCRSPTARYEQNLKLTNEVEESERTVKSQKRQIEALQSQLLLWQTLRLEQVYWNGNARFLSSEFLYFLARIIIKKYDKVPTVFWSLSERTKSLTIM